MGGLSSKTFKLHKGDKKTSASQKRSSVTGVEYRDKEFQLSRETQSAYYYDHKHKETKKSEPSGSAVDPQKRVVLRRAADSDQTLFRRVRETPTAIYYIPNDEDETDIDFDKEEDGDKKHIVIENPTTIVEETIKVIRDGSSGIIIRSGNSAKDVNDKETGVNDNSTAVVANVIDENEEADDQKRESASKEGTDDKDDQTENVSATTDNEQNKTMSETETAISDEHKEISTTEKDQTEVKSTTTEKATVPKPIETNEKTQENKDHSCDKEPMLLSNEDVKKHQDLSKDTIEPSTESNKDEQSENQSIRSDPITADDKQPIAKEQTDSEVTPVDSTIDEPLPCYQPSVTNTDLQVKELASDEKITLPDLNGDDDQIVNLDTKNQVNEQHATLDMHIVSNAVGETNEEQSTPNIFVSHAVATDDPKTESISHEQIPSLEDSDDTKEKEQPPTDQMLSGVTKDVMLETEEIPEKRTEQKESNSMEVSNEPGSLPKYKSDCAAPLETDKSKGIIDTADADTSDENKKGNADLEDSNADDNKGEDS